ncbi:MAG: hypothetical protein QNJ81_12245 [Acidimicrobiia bacterium]|nr:hypothetical protein [Acidimicrobiia bacterium]
MLRLGRRRVGLLVVALALAGTACDSENVRGVPGDSPDAPDGYVVYDGFTEGFTVALPDSYIAFGPDELDYDELFAAVPDEVLDGFETQAAQIFSFGGVLVAFDTTGSTDEFVENLNILKLPTTSTPVNLYLSASRTQLESLGAEVISAEVVDHPDGDAIRMEFSAPSIGSTGVNFSVLTDDFDWTVTMSTGIGSELAIDPDVVFASFRIASG